MQVTPRDDRNNEPVSSSDGSFVIALNNGTKYRVMENADGELEIMGINHLSNCMVVKPQASNVIQITTIKS